MFGFVTDHCGLAVFSLTAISFKIHWNCCIKFVSPVGFSVKNCGAIPVSLPWESFRAGLGNDISGWSSLDYLLQPGPPVRGQCPVWLWISQMEIHNLSGQPDWVFYHPHSKNASFCSDGIFHGSVSAHCLLSWHWEKSASLHPLIRSLSTLISLGLFQSKQFLLLVF